MNLPQIVQNKTAIVNMGILFGFNVDKVQRIAVSARNMDDLKNKMCSEHIKTTGEKPLSVDAVLEII